MLYVDLDLLADQITMASKMLNDKGLSEEKRGQLEGMVDMLIDIEAYLQEEKACVLRPARQELNIIDNKRGF